MRAGIPAAVTFTCLAQLLAACGEDRPAAPEGQNTGGSGGTGLDGTGSVRPAASYSPTRGARTLLSHWVWAPPRNERAVRQRAEQVPRSAMPPVARPRPRHRETPPRSVGNVGWADLHETCSRRRIQR